MVVHNGEPRAKQGVVPDRSSAEEAFMPTFPELAELVAQGYTLVVVASTALSMSLHKRVGTPAVPGTWDTAGVAERLVYHDDVGQCLPPTTFENTSPSVAPANATEVFRETGLRVMRETASPTPDVPSSCAAHQSMASRQACKRKGLRALARTIRRPAHSTACSGRRRRSSRRSRRGHTNCNLGGTHASVGARRTGG